MVGSEPCIHGGYVPRLPSVGMYPATQGGYVPWWVYSSLVPWWGYSSLVYTSLYTPGYTILPLYTVLSVHHRPLVLRCQLMMPWALTRD